MTKTLNRHIDEVIMILAELLIAVLLMLQLPFLGEIISVCVGILSILIGACCIKRYYHTAPAYLRYEPELRRGFALIIIGAALATMQKWFTVTSSAPTVALGLTLLMVAIFKTAVVCDAKSSDVPHLFFPALSTLFTFSLSLFSMFASDGLLSTRWACMNAFMIAILLVDICEIFSSEMENRESWSMQIRCWL